ncbi:MAG: Lrp/AsnC ligand binding domain-containing protein [Promethearchaeati archaeon SRVP18_Atabeyarchaeia-1]
MPLGRMLFAVVITNLLWGLIPIPAVEAMKSYSLFTMLLFRFFYTSLACFLLVGVLRIRSPEVKGIGAYLTSTNRAYGRRNVPQLLSLVIVAFMLSVSLTLFFFSYNLVGVVIATMVSESITPVLLAFWNWAKGTEKIDILKLIYMTLLVLAVLVISLARVEADAAVKSIGFLFVAICAVFWTAYIALIAKDTPSRKETEAVRFSVGNYRMARSTLKLGVTFMFSGLMIFPLVLGLPLFSQEPELVSQCNRFFDDLSSNLFSASLNMDILVLSFGLTFVPYFLLYAAQAFWPKEALTFDQWSSILGLITPLVAAYVGILILGELVRMDYILIATVFLVTSIAMRYFHEVTNKVVGFIFLEIDLAKKSKVYSQLKGIRELQEIHAITGKESDIYAEAVTSNLNHLYLLVSQKIRAIDGVRNVDVELVQKIRTPKRK